MGISFVNFLTKNPNQNIIFYGGGGNWGGGGGGRGVVWLW